MSFVINGKSIDVGLRDEDMQNMIVLPNNIDDVSIMFPIFKLENESYYSIDIANNDNPELFAEEPVLQWDEIQDDGVYVWIIGLNHQGEITLWAKKVRTVQEIQTKHINIVKELLRDGFITSILFAGELNKMMDEISFNVLSGTFMTNNSDKYVKGRSKYLQKNHARIIRIITNILDTLLQPTFIINDDNIKTFINIPMTADVLQRYRRNGANVYKYPNEDTAYEYRDENVSGKIARRDILIKQIERFKKMGFDTTDIENDIKKIDEQPPKSIYLLGKNDALGRKRKTKKRKTKTKKRLTVKNRKSRKGMFRNIN